MFANVYEWDRHPYTVRSRAEEKAWAFQQARILSAIRKRRITVRNQNESPLLRLPGEVRHRIWEYVFEHPAVHIEYSKIAIKDPGFYGELAKSKVAFAALLAAGSPPIAWQPLHRTCHAICHEEAKVAQSSTDSEHEHDPSFALTHSAHRKICGKDKEPGLWRKIQIPVLEVSKQVYAETRLMLISSITFVVQDAYSWEYFTNNFLNAAQRSAVRRIHLLPHIEGIGREYIGMRLARFFERTNLENLAQLRHVEVSFILGRFWWSDLFAALKDLEKDSPSSTKDVLMECAVGLAMPSIETLNVSISNPEPLGPGDSAMQWKKSERAEWTRLARERMLQDLKMSPEESAAALAKAGPEPIWGRRLYDS